MKSWATDGSLLIWAIRSCDERRGEGELIEGRDGRGHRGTRRRRKLAQIEPIPEEEDGQGVNTTG